MPRKPSPHHQIVEHYKRVRASFLWYPKSRDSVAYKHAKLLLEAGYSVEDVQGCIDWLNEDKWAKGKVWSLPYVQKKMPEYLVERAERQAQVLRNQARFGQVY